MRGLRRCVLVALFSVVSACLLGACVFVDTESMVATEVARRFAEYATQTAEAPTAEPTATFTPEPTVTPTAPPTPDATATWVVSQRTLDAATASARATSDAASAQERATARAAESTRAAQRQACETLWDLYGDRNAIVDEWNVMIEKEWNAREFSPLVDMLDELSWKARQAPLPASAEHLRAGLLAWCELNHQLIDLYRSHYRTGAESYYLQAEATRRQWNAVAAELHGGISDYCSR